jgi:hypothetical protein
MTSAQNFNCRLGTFLLGGNVSNFACQFKRHRCQAKGDWKFWTTNPLETFVVIFDTVGGSDESCLETLRDVLIVVRVGA